MSYADAPPPTMPRQVQMPSSFAFRLLTKDSIPDAIKKAERYRLLGEPDEAGSVCLDILQVDPDNQEARVDLILAISDQFGRERRPRVDLAMKIAAELTDEYQRRYYEAVVLEREARAHIDLQTPPVLVFPPYFEAMGPFAPAAPPPPPPRPPPPSRPPRGGQWPAAHPPWWAAATAPALLRTPSFARMCETWTEAVFSEMNRAAATSLLLRPSVRRRSTSSSRGVSAASGPGAAARAPAARRSAVPGPADCPSAEGSSGGRGRARRGRRGPASAPRREGPGPSRTT